MSFNEAPDNLQVKPEVASEPFDPTDTARMAELTKKFEGGQEAVANFEIVNRAFPGFEGATIVKKGDTYFALTKNGEALWASEFKLTPDGGVGATYQVRDLEQFKDVLGEIEASKAQEKINTAKTQLMSLADMSGTMNNGFDPFNGSYSGESRTKIDEIKNLLNLMSSSEQEQLAEHFFQNKIIDGFGSSNMQAALRVMGALGGTPFSSKLRALEDARLKGEGYAGLSI